MMRGYAWEAPCGLEQSDRVMRDTFLLPMNHTCTEEEIEHVAKVALEEITR